MVAPDRHLANVVHGRPGFLRELGFGPIVVEPCHGSELAGIDIWRVALSDQCVGISGVAYHQHLDIPAGDGVDGLALHAKNSGVGLEQVFALHAGTAGTRADQ